MNLNVQTSSFRNAYGTQQGPENSYTNIKARIGTDTNHLKCNLKYFAVPWESAQQSVASIFIHPLKKRGRVRDDPTNQIIQVAHSNSITDFEFHPYKEDILASVSQDCHLKLWKIPENIIGDEIAQTPVWDVIAHQKAVMSVGFHHIANELLTTTSRDASIKLWDLNQQKDIITVTDQFKDIIQSLCWNFQGNLFATASKDKSVRVFDPRNKTPKVIENTEAHTGAKGIRLVWLSNTPNLVTAGFSKTSERQICLWDTRNMSTAQDTITIDTSPGNILPFYDEGTGVIFMAAKGSGSIKYYEVSKSANKLLYLSEFTNTNPQAAIALLPKRVVNVNVCEFARFLRLTGTTVDILSFQVPRKNANEFFHDDVFPPCLSGEPALTAEQWLNGENAEPKLMSLQPPGKKAMSEVEKEKQQSKKSAPGASGGNNNNAEQADESSETSTDEDSDDDEEEDEPPQQVKVKPDTQPAQKPQETKPAPSAPAATQQQASPATTSTPAQSTTAPQPAPQASPAQNTAPTQKPQEEQKPSSTQQTPSPSTQPASKPQEASTPSSDTKETPANVSKSDSAAPRRGTMAIGARQGSDNRPSQPPKTGSWIRSNHSDSSSQLQSNSAKPVEQKPAVTEASKQTKPKKEKKEKKEKHTKKTLEISGWLHKEPPKKSLFSKELKKRWFSVSGAVLYYFENESSIISLGNINISTPDVIIRNGSAQHVFEIVTRDRTYVLYAANQQERDKWVSTLQEVKATVRPPSALSQSYGTLRKKNSSIFKSTDEALDQPANDPSINIPMSERLSGFVDKKSPKGTGWQNRFFSIAGNGQLTYAKPSSASVQGSISLKLITGIRITEGQDKRCFQIETPERTYFLRAQIIEERDYWVQGIKKIIMKYFAGSSSSLKESQTESVKGYDDLSNDALFIEDTPLEGYLMKKSPGLMKGWQKRWFSTKGPLLNYYQNQGSSVPLDSIPATEILSVKLVSDSASDIAPRDRLFAFQLQTPGRIYYLMASTPNERDDWISKLEEWRTDFTTNQEKDEVESESESESEEEEEDEEETTAASTTTAAKTTPDSSASKPKPLLTKGNSLIGSRRSLLGSSRTSRGEDVEHPPQSKPSATQVAATPAPSSQTQPAAQQKPATTAEAPKQTTQQSTSAQTTSSNAPATQTQQTSPQPTTPADSSATPATSHAPQSESKTSAEPASTATEQESTGEPKRAKSTDGKDKKVDHLKQIGIDVTTEEKVDNSVTIIDPIDVKNGKYRLLIQVLGRRVLRCKQVPLSAETLNSNHVFILDAGATIYQWQGSKCNRMQKAYALDVSSRIRFKDRNGVAQIVILDEGDTDKDAPQFWEILGKRSGTPQTQEQADEDALAKLHDTNVNVYRIHNSKSRFRRLLPVHTGSAPDSQGRPSKVLLSRKYCFVVDCYSEIFVWIGKQSTVPSRKLAMRVARALCTSPYRPIGSDSTPIKRPSFTAITRLVENGETVLFKEKFGDYPGMLPISVSGVKIKGNIAETKQQQEIDAVGLYQSKPLKTKNPVPSELHSSSIKVYKIEEFNLIEIPSKFHGHFWTEDSFIVVFSYEDHGSEKHLIYFWQGRDSTVLSKGTSAYLTVEMSDKLGDAPQIRVTQHKEPPHLISIFNGHFIIHKGTYNSFIARTSVPTSLYQFAIRHQFLYITELEANASSLNSLHTYILRNDTSLFVWQGKFSPPSSKQAAKNINPSIFSSDSAPQTTLVEEGTEPQSFWKLLNVEDRNQAKYSQSQDMNDKPVRLYQFTTGSGVVEAFEVFEFCQDDLEANSVYLLDCYYKLILWFGHHSKEVTKVTAMHTALKYVEHVTKTDSNRNSALPTFVITTPYQEPVSFTQYFFAWSTSLFPKDKKQLPPSDLLEVLEVLKKYTRTTYSYQELLSDPLPPGVDSTKLETYLNDDEFLEIFKMTKEEFAAVPDWKRQQMKKDAYLF